MGIQSDTAAKSIVILANGIDRVATHKVTRKIGSRYVDLFLDIVFDGFFWVAVVTYGKTDGMVNRIKTEQTTSFYSSDKAMEEGLKLIEAIVGPRKAQSKKSKEQIRQKFSLVVLHLPSDKIVEFGIGVWRDGSGVVTHVDSADVDHDGWPNQVIPVSAVGGIVVDEVVTQILHT